MTARGENQRRDVGASCELKVCEVRVGPEDDSSAADPSGIHRSAMVASFMWSTFG